VRIFLDANLLFSAAKSDGAIRQLLAMLTQRGHALCVDGYVIEEARRNLIAKSPASVAYLDDLLAKVEWIPIRAPAGGRDTYGLPEMDRPVLAAAITGRCDILVTGDRTHFARLYGKHFEGVEVVSPAMLALRILV